MSYVKMFFSNYLFRIFAVQNENVIN